MAYTSLSELFAATADSIRSKTGSSEKIVANDFPAAIAAIETGGENLDAELEEQDELIEEIAAGLVGKALPGGGGDASCLIYRGIVCGEVYRGTYKVV